MLRIILCIGLCVVVTACDVSSPLPRITQRPGSPTGTKPDTITDSDGQTGLDGVADGDDAGIGVDNSPIPDGDLPDQVIAPDATPDATVDASPDSTMCNPVDPTACNDDNPCTVNSCGGDGKCKSTPVPGCCQGNGDCQSPPGKCYEASGSCSQNHCVYAPKSGCCESNSDCQSPPNADCYQAAGVCNTDIGRCDYQLKDNLNCEDGDKCTLGDKCANVDGTFVCQAGTAVTCNTPPNTVCYGSDGVCMKDTGSCAYPTFTTCNDGVNCTEQDSCQPNTEGVLVCVGTPKDCSPTNACQIADGCQEDSGTCSYQPKADCCLKDADCPAAPTPCEASRCQGNACVVVPKSDGDQCDDGNANTWGGICDKGACTPLFDVTEYDMIWNRMPKNDTLVETKIHQVYCDTRIAPQMFFAGEFTSKDLDDIATRYGYVGRRDPTVPTGNWHIYTSLTGSAKPGDKAISPLLDIASTTNKPGFASNGTYGFLAVGEKGTLVTWAVGDGNDFKLTQLDTGYTLNAAWGVYLRSAGARNGGWFYIGGKVTTGNGDAILRCRYQGKVIQCAEAKLLDPEVSEAVKSADPNFANNFDITSLGGFTLASGSTEIVFAGNRRGGIFAWDQATSPQLTDTFTYRGYACSPYEDLTTETGPIVAECKNGPPIEDIFGHNSSITAVSGYNNLFGVGFFEQTNYIWPNIDALVFANVHERRVFESWMWNTSEYLTRHVVMLETDATTQKKWLAYAQVRLRWSDTKFFAKVHRLKEITDLNEVSLHTVHGCTNDEIFLGGWERRRGQIRAIILKPRDPSLLVP